MYGFAGGDPVNSRDPFGLCPQGWYEAPNGDCFNPGAALGLAISSVFATAEGLVKTLAGALRSSSAAVAVEATSAGGGLTGRIANALEASGPQMSSRVDAVLKQIPTKLKALMTTDAETGTVTIRGGAGNNAREIILNTDGSSMVRAFDATKNVWNTVKEIKPPQQ